MNIPKHLKVGGFIYKVIVTEDLIMGEDCIGETNCADLTIKIRPNAAKEEAFIHEMLHAIFNMQALKHDEKIIESLAQGLHTVIKIIPQFLRLNQK